MQKIEKFLEKFPSLAESQVVTDEMMEQMEGGGGDLCDNTCLVTCTTCLLGCSSSKKEGTSTTDPENPPTTEPTDPENPSTTEPTDPENPSTTDPDDPDNPSTTNPL